MNASRKRIAVGVGIVFLFGMCILVLIPRGARYDLVKLGMTETEVEEILGPSCYSDPASVKAKWLSVDAEEPDQLIAVIRKGYRINDRRECYVEYDSNGIEVFKSSPKPVAPSRIERFLITLYP